jgi:hypothetical protein
VGAVNKGDMYIRSLCGHRGAATKPVLERRNSDVSEELLDWKHDKFECFSFCECLVRSTPTETSSRAVTKCASWNRPIRPYKLWHSGWRWTATKETASHDGTDINTS